MFQIYNTATRKKEVFSPLQPPNVGMYSCGPTVYDFPHIGNYRAYISSDVLARVLLYQGYALTHVMNITDVDDKTIRNSRARDMSLKSFTSVYEQAFYEDLHSLNIKSITVHPKATDHINEMVALIEVLLEKGVAYRAADGGVYYAIEKNSQYGKLACLDRENLRAGASGRMSLDEYSKDDVRDFALWKAWTPDDGDVSWETSLGKGRPGWHIECSAMSMKYLGQSFDIHAGGIDLVFPHHENEMAQSEMATRKPFVGYWVHNEWLLVDGKKMSKSLGNFFTLRDVLQRGYSSLDFRYFVYSAHYRQQLNFTWDAMEAAREGRERLSMALYRLKLLSTRSSSSPSHKAQKMSALFLVEFEEAVFDDLNISRGLAALHEHLKKIHKEKVRLSPDDYTALLEGIYKADTVLGLQLASAGESVVIPQHVEALREARVKARAAKEWEAADALRKAIEEAGFDVEDASDASYLIPRI
ncbi:cysteine--tRNA ligase [Candidatus Uhrbacteria bacterium]|nr:cysteine--tRNA ligase [Candidatus Uhrbacteria bacterium]